MKDIKFRAFWDGELIYSDSYDEEYFMFDFGRDGVSLATLEIPFEPGTGVELSSFWRTLKDIKFEQFTGLKDKDGKEIYEGDILRNMECDLFGPVTFEDGMFILDEDTLGWRVSVGSLYIVGNINENPYLLED